MSDQCERNDSRQLGRCAAVRCSVNASRGSSGWGRRRSPRPDQPFGHAAPDHGLEQLAQEIAVAEPAVPVLGEGGVVGDVPLQNEAAEPAVGQVEVDLFAPPPLGSAKNGVSGAKTGLQLRSGNCPP